MAQTLPKDAAEERLRWISPYFSSQRSLKEIAEIAPFSYRTLKRWVKLYKVKGLEGLVPESRRPNHHPREYSDYLVEKVRKLRMETGLGPDVLAILLQREGLKVSHSGLGKLLKREKLSRKRKRLEPKEKWRPQTSYPGEIVEIDVLYVRKFQGKWLYQFTAVDSYSRWRYAWVTPEQNNQTAVNFLQKVLTKAPFRIRGIKTDNASIFTNRYTGYAKSTNPLKPRVHIFDKMCLGYNLNHYLIDPGKPQQNGRVERLQRTDRERFWSKVKFQTLMELKRKQEEYINWSNKICPHLGINGLTPEEKLASFQGTNVRV